MFKHEKWRRSFRLQSIFDVLPSLSSDIHAYPAFNASVLLDKAELNPTIRYLGKLSASLGRKSTRRSIDLVLCHSFFREFSFSSFFFVGVFVIGTCFKRWINRFLRWFLKTKVLFIIRMEFFSNLCQMLPARKRTIISNPMSTTNWKVWYGNRVCFVLLTFRRDVS